MQQVRDEAQDWEERHREFFKDYRAAYKRRLESEAAYAHFEGLQAQCHALPPRFNPPDDPYRTHREPLEFWRAMQRLEDRKPTDYDVLIAYLERDPYAFRSGYTKEKILRRLKSAPLTALQKVRLRTMLLAQIQKPPRREIRDYCRLAIVLDEPELRRELERLEEIGGTWAGWMCAALRRAAGETK